MPKPFSVTALIRENGRILSVSRKTNPEDLGLPGGKVDPGQTPEQALAAEVQQETGLIVTAYRVVFEDNDRVEGSTPKPCRTYEILAWTGRIQTEETGVVAWVKPGDLLTPKCSFRDYNRKLFENLNIRV